MRSVVEELVSFLPLTDSVFVPIQEEVGAILRVEVMVYVAMVIG